MTATTPSARVRTRGRLRAIEKVFTDYYAGRSLPTKETEFVDPTILDHLAHGAAYAAQTLAYSTLPVNGGRERPRTVKATVQPHHEDQPTR
jgi:hypothetical protein